MDYYSTNAVKIMTRLSLQKIYHANYTTKIYDTLLATHSNRNSWSYGISVETGYFVHMEEQAHKYIAAQGLNYFNVF
jgi:hypothetical protein